MMLSSHLSPSRHGVYNFRWPIPPSQEGKRTTVRICLRTRCPDQAGDLARHLASCGRILRENNALAGLRQTEIREKVQAYFKAQLDQSLDWLDRRGLSKNALEDVRCEMLDHESSLDMEMESDQSLPVKPFLRKPGLTVQDWQAIGVLTRWHRKQPDLFEKRPNNHTVVTARVRECAGNSNSLDADFPRIHFVRVGE